MKVTGKQKARVPGDAVGVVLFESRVGQKKDKRRIRACRSSKWRIILLISGSLMESVVPSTEQKVNEWFLNRSEPEEILVLTKFGSLILGLRNVE